MGIQGLATYLHDNQRTLGQTLVFAPQSSTSKPTPLIVDGWS